MRHLDGRSLLTDTDAPTVAWMDEYLPTEYRAELQAAVGAAIDGLIGWVFSRAVPITNEAGEIVEWFGAASDITERRRTNEHLRLVINELNHRVKNTLAMVQAIAMRTFRDATDMVEAQGQFAARLVALAQADDLLTGERWAGASLRSAIEQAVRPHKQSDDRCRLTGDDLRISPKTALSLSLAMHELSTNAVKYGAWSNDHGQVRIDWSVDDGVLHIEWHEEGGPPVHVPERRGFGSRLIERGLAAELGGTVTLRFEPAGVRCVIDAPMTFAAGE